MFRRLTEKDSFPDPIDSLIADAELRLHSAEIGTDEYRLTANTIIKLHEIQKNRQVTSDRARKEMVGEVIAGFMFLLFAVKPELAQKYSKMYWDWKVFHMFNWWR